MNYDNTDEETLINEFLTKNMTRNEKELYYAEKEREKR